MNQKLIQHIIKNIKVKILFILNVVRKGMVVKE